MNGPENERATKQEVTAAPSEQVAWSAESLFAREVSTEVSSLAAKASFVGFISISTDNLDRFIIRQGWFPATQAGYRDAGFRPLRFHTAELSQDELLEIKTGSNMTTAGKALQQAIHGERVLELASGPSNSTCEKWVELFGGESYIGVDLIANNTHKKDAQFEASYVKSDMLEFVSRMEDDSFGVINLNGLEGHSSDANRYAAALDKELSRILKPGGLLILDDLSLGLLSPDSNGFKKVFPTEEWRNLERSESLPESDQGFAAYGYARDFQLFEKSAIPDQ